MCTAGFTIGGKNSRAGRGRTKASDICGIRVCAGPGWLGSCIRVGSLLATKRTTQLGGGTTSRGTGDMGPSGGRGHGRVELGAVQAGVSPFLAREETTEEGHWDEGRTRASVSVKGLFVCFCWLSD